MSLNAEPELDIWTKEWQNAYNFFNSKGNIKTKGKLKTKWYNEFHKDIAELKQNATNILQNSEENCIELDEANRELKDELAKSIPKAQIEAIFNDDNLEAYQKLYEIKFLLNSCKGKGVSEDGWCVKCKKGIESGQTICENCKGKNDRNVDLTI